LVVAASGPAGAQRWSKPPASCDRAAFRMIVDVGHNVTEPGATSARGRPEYEFNLTLGRTVASHLREAGFTRTTLLITNRPKTLGLIERVSRLNRMPADLFLSIHHDSVPENLLETWEHEGRVRRFNDKFPGYSLFISAENSRYVASLLFAQIIGNMLQTRGLSYTPHYTDKIMGRYRRELVDEEAGVYRFDKLHVLRSVSMPAVLLEAGSIVNRNEELVLSSPERQSIVAETIANAVALYCELNARRRR
jgi:N-acetylmuramoyl-L-alanine amidase